MHAYVLMRNHFHLAVETPEPTLGEGMHWRQSSMATRFNRLRLESGHLFQGRYQALLIEGVHALARVVDYIHLDAVRAKIVAPEQATGYRLSSLAALLRDPRPLSSTVKDWLAAIGDWPDNAAGHRAYAAYLLELARDEAALGPRGLGRSGQGLGNRFARVAAGLGRRTRSARTDHWAATHRAHGTA